MLTLLAPRPRFPTALLAETGRPAAAPNAGPSGWRAGLGAGLFGAAVFAAVAVAGWAVGH